MKDALIAFLSQRMALTPEHAEFARSVVVPKRARKGEVLQRAGEVAQHGMFVAKGCLRSFSIDEQGKEHILRFAPEGWWLTDLASIMNRTPSVQFIDAIEDSDVLLLDWQSHDALMARIPGFAVAFATGLGKATAARELRILDSLSATAEQRYVRFLGQYASIAQRIPQRMLASYLGMTPETLSRVRKQLATKRRSSSRTAG